MAADPAPLSDDAVYDAIVGDPEVMRRIEDRLARAARGEAHWISHDEALLRLLHVAAREPTSSPSPDLERDDRPGM